MTAQFVYLNIIVGPQINYSSQNAFPNKRLQLFFSVKKITVTLTSPKCLCSTVRYIIDLSFYSFPIPIISSMILSYHNFNNPVYSLPIAVVTSYHKTAHISYSLEVRSTKWIPLG